MHWNRKLSTLACALTLVAACGRSRLASGDVVPGFDLGGGAQAGASGGTAPGTGATGATGATVPGVPPGRTPDDRPPPPAGVGGPNGVAGVSGGVAGRGNPGVAGRGAPGSGGRGGFPADAGVAGASPDKPIGMDPGSVLNPQRCATDEPFVLSIDPGGRTGQVQGWLESAPSVLFDENDLPRFGASPLPEESGDLALWWSIAGLSVDQSEPSTLWFYAANGSTEVAHVTVNRPAAVGDATMLPYTSWAVGPVAVGEVAVFHHIPTDRYVAVQAMDLYGTEDSDRRDQCTAIDARWVFAPRGTADFSAAR